jgi:hypothetical protein
VRKLKRSFATYRLEDGYLSSLEIVIRFDIFAIIAIYIRKLRRHPLVPLVVVFARRRRQGGFRGRVIVLGRRCLNRRNNVYRCLHYEGRRVTPVVLVSEGLRSSLAAGSGGSGDVGGDHASLLPPRRALSDI